MLMSDLFIIVLNIIKGPYLWLILSGFVVIIYLLLSLINKSFQKPLKSLGIAIIISGILFIVLRFLTPTLVDFIFEEYANMIKTLIPIILQTITTIGIIYILIGILSLVIYKKTKSLE